MKWMKWKKKKWTALLLSFSMLMNMIPQIGTSAVVAGELGCAHHAAHTAECGYAKAVEAHECMHVCGDACYTKTLTCPHTEHDETCGYTAAVEEILESPCTYIHDPVVCGANEETCPHVEHDETCGYIAGVPGIQEIPCGHEHTNDCYTASNVCSHAHDGDCGYTEAAAGSPCTFVCESCAQTGEDENTGDIEATEGSENTGATEGNDNTGDIVDTENSENTGATEGSENTGATEDGDNTGDTVDTENSENTGDTENSENTGDTENSENTGDTENSENTGDTENSENTGATEGSENTGDIVDTENGENTGDTEDNENTGDIGDTDNSENTGDIEDTGNSENTGDIVDTEDGETIGGIGEDENTDDIIDIEEVEESEESEEISDEEENTGCTCGAIVDGNGVVTHAENCPEYRVELGDVDHIRVKLIEKLYGSAEGRIICDFDRYTTTPGRHEGIDFAREPEAPLYAVVEGELIAVSEGNDTEPLSKIVIYNKKFDRTVIYFHADPLDTLTVGMQVKVGDLLGYESNRDSADYHTHLELRRGWTEYGSISVDDDVLDNENPYPMWEEMLEEKEDSDDQLTTEQLYEAMYLETTLRGLFDLLNYNIDALLGFDIKQVYALEAWINDLQEKNSPLTQDEEEALEQLLDNVEYLKDILGYGTCWSCGGKDGLHSAICSVKGHSLPTRARIAYTNTSTGEGSVHSSKDIVEDESGNHAIQIDVYTEGIVSTLPTEIVLVVDQSGSMFQTAGNSRQFQPTTNPEGWMTYDQFIEYGDKVKGAQYPGYYMAVTENVNYGLNSVDHNGASNRNRKYANALIKYTQSNGWMRSNQTVTADYQYEDLTINPTWKNITSQNLSTLGFNKLREDTYPTWTANYSGKKVKFFKSLYGATIDAYEAFLKEVSGIKNVKIAIVGFSSPINFGEEWNDSNSSNYGGTGIIKNGTFTHAKNISDYSDWWMTAESQEDLDQIAASVQKIFSNYNETCTQDGFLLANKIFEASTEANANRVVLFFTDGVPTTRSSDTTVTSNRPEDETYNAAIVEAKKTKEKASVYVYGPSTLSDKAKKFLWYLSSDYPDAQSMSNAGTNTGEGHYGIAGSAADLEASFQELGKQIFEESNALTSASEIRDTVTPYFDIGGDFNGGNIIVQELKNTGAVDAEGNAIFDEDSPTILYSEAEGIKTVTLTRNIDVDYDQTLSDGSVVTRTGDQVIVSGYDYGRNTVYPGEARGAKLRLLIPIEPDPAFVGGNWAATNSPDSGLFPDNNPDSPPVGGDGTDEDGYFPPPHEDVEVKEDEVIEADVEARAGAAFLEAIPYNDLLKLVSVTIKGKDGNPDNNLVLQMGVPNYGVDAWKTDYVFIETHLFDTLVDANGDLILDANGNPKKGEELTVGEDISIRRDHAVIAEAYIWSRYTYNKETGEAILQEQRPADLKPAAGIINLTVYYPTFVFNDVTLYHGQPLVLATEAWGDEMDATKYLKWYTNNEYKQLSNPQPAVNLNGYEDLPKGSWGETDDVIIQEVPVVYFKVDPIDESLWGNHTGAVDDHFYEKFGTYMGKEPVNMNVRVFYRNDGDTGKYDPDNPTATADAMRNAFFLHVQTRGNSIRKHTSGSSNSDEVYWGPEFRIIPAYCELTIEKTGGLPNETYVFDIYRGLPNEYSKFERDENGEPKLIQREEEPTYYTTVSITTDKNGKGSVTLKELPVGVYKVSEDMDWSWRFEKMPEISWKYEDGTAGTGEKIYLLSNDSQDKAVVNVNNQKSTEQWLSGMSAVAENVYGIQNNLE